MVKNDVLIRVYVELLRIMKGMYTVRNILFTVTFIYIHLF